MADGDDFLVGQGSSDARNFGFHLLKAENELFKEESNLVQTLIQVKRKETKKNGEEWFILENKEIVMHLKNSRLNTQEKAFLRTLDGVQFLIKQYKNGVTSFAKMKEALKGNV